jgi:hypothetical protein
MWGIARQEAAPPPRLTSTCGVLTVGGTAQRPARHELIKHGATGVYLKTKQAHRLMEVKRQAGHLAIRLENRRDDVGGTFVRRCAIVDAESVGIGAQPLSNASVLPPHANTLRNSRARRSGARTR